MMCLPLIQLPPSAADYMIAPQQSLRMIPFGMNAENVKVDAGGRLRVVAAGIHKELKDIAATIRLLSL